MKKKIIFIAASLLISLALFLTATIPGYQNIYNAVFAASMSDYKGSDSYGLLFRDNSNLLIYYCADECPLYIEEDAVRYLAGKNSLDYIVLDMGFSYVKNNEADIFGWLAEFNEDRPFPVSLIGAAADTPQDIIEYTDTLIRQTDNLTLINRSMTAKNQSVDKQIVYIEALRGEVERNEQKYRQLMRENYFNFKFALNNLAVSGENDRAVENFITIYNKNIRSKYYLMLGCDEVCTLLESYPSLKRKTDSFNVISVDETIYDGDSETYILDNRLLKYFEKYRRAVYAVNFRTPQVYEAPEDYVIVCNE